MVTLTEFVFGVSGIPRSEIQYPQPLMQSFVSDWVNQSSGVLGIKTTTKIRGMAKLSILKSL
jgi:hypothetical protein